MNPALSDFIDLMEGDEGPMGKPIGTIVLQMSSLIVYLDSEGVIQWSTSAGYHNWNAHFGEIQSSISYWESVCNKVFKPSDAYIYKSLLAEGYARILDDRDYQMALSAIEAGKDGIQKHGSEILKQQYLLSSFLCALVTGLAIIIIVINKKNVALILNNRVELYEIMLASLFGGIGAFVFSSLKIKTYKPELVISKELHRIDGGLRVVYGIITGVIAVLAVKSNFALGFLPTHSMYTLCFIGIIAGASDMLIPNLIKKVESQ